MSWFESGISWNFQLNEMLDNLEKLVKIVDGEEF